VTMTPGDAHSCVSFSNDDLERMKKAVKDAEAKTSGEIRVVIGSTYDPGVSDIQKQARYDFEDYGLLDTQGGSGVLLLVLIKERMFTITGDYGVYSKLPQSYWDHLAITLSRYFRQDDFVGGICHVVEAIGLQLSAYFPRHPNDVNELPDGVIVKEV